MMPGCLHRQIDAKADVVSSLQNIVREDLLAFKVRARQSGQSRLRELTIGSRHGRYVGRARRGDSNCVMDGWPLRAVRAHTGTNKGTRTYAYFYTVARAVCPGLAVYTALQLATVV